jgi:hypothetical protein
MLERKVLQKILGLVLENGCWRWSKNSEIWQFYDEYDVKCIQLGRLTWAGHVLSMEEIDPARKVCCTKQGGTGDRRVRAQLR